MSDADEVGRLRAALRHQEGISQGHRERAASFERLLDEHRLAVGRALGLPDGEWLAASDAEVAIAGLRARLAALEASPAVRLPLRAPARGGDLRREIFVSALSGAAVLSPGEHEGLSSDRATLLAVLRAGLALDVADAGVRLWAELQGLEPGDVASTPWAEARRPLAPRAKPETHAEPEPGDEGLLEAWAGRLGDGEGDCVSARELRGLRLVAAFVRRELAGEVERITGLVEVAVAEAGRGDDPRPELLTALVGLDRLKKRVRGEGGEGG